MQITLPPVMSTGNRLRLMPEADRPDMIRPAEIEEVVAKMARIPTRSVNTADKKKLAALQRAAEAKAAAAGTPVVEEEEDEEILRAAGQHHHAGLEGDRHGPAQHRQPLEPRDRAIGWWCHRCAVGLWGGSQPPSTGSSSPRRGEGNETWPAQPA